MEKKNNMKLFIFPLVLVLFALNCFGQTDTIIYFKGEDFAILKSRVPLDCQYEDTFSGNIIKYIDEKRLLLNNKIFYKKNIEKGVINSENSMTGQIDTLPCYRLYYKQRRFGRLYWVK